jgi:hypothetical protein
MIWMQAQKQHTLQQNMYMNKKTLFFFHIDPMFYTIVMIHCYCVPDYK